MGKPLKEHIAEPFAGAHSDFVRTGMCLREEKGMSCRIKFCQHTLQLQREKSGSSEEFDHYTPKPDEPTLEPLQKISTGITEEDLQKVIMNLGDIVVEEGNNPNIPGHTHKSLQKHAKTARKQAKNSL